MTRATRRAGDRRAGIITAVREQLGLRLESRREPAPMLVVDSIELPVED